MGGGQGEMKGWDGGVRWREGGGCVRGTMRGVRVKGDWVMVRRRGREEGGLGLG